MVRSASYAALSPPDRRRVHRAVADTLDPRIDLERRAGHLAAAATGPDEEVAGVLVAAGERAAARGALRTQTELLARAAELTSDDDERALRYIDASAAARLLGDRGRSGALLSLARTSARTPDLRVRIEHEQVLDDVVTGPFHSLPRRLLPHLRELDRHDRTRARAAALRVVSIYQLAGSFAERTDAGELAETIRGLPRRTAAPTVHDLLLDGWAAVHLDGWADGAGDLCAGLEAWQRHDPGALSAWVHGTLPGLTACELWDYDAMGDVAARNVRVLEAAHSAVGLANALPTLLRQQALVGRLDEATLTLDVLRERFDLVGRPDPTAVGFHAELEALRGDEAAAAAALTRLRSYAAAQGNGAALARASLADALLANATCRYARAAAAAGAVLDRPLFGYTAQALPELVEAAVHCDDGATALRAVTLMRDRAAHATSDIARGIRARTEALVADDTHAGPLFGESIELLSGTCAAVDLGRSHLLYGEWLRRRHQRLQARTELRAAADIFGRVGAGAFERRARVELEATGEHSRRREPTLGQELTPRERHIAALAGRGATNQEIGDRLYISANTVDYHLRKVFRKLNIGSRRQLVECAGVVEPGHRL